MKGRHFPWLVLPLSSSGLPSQPFEHHRQETHFQLAQQVMFKTIRGEVWGTRFLAQAGARSRRKPWEHGPRKCESGTLGSPWD